MPANSNEGIMSARDSDGKQKIRVDTSIIAAPMKNVFGFKFLSPTF
jgi:hypothetical protein